MLSRVLRTPPVPFPLPLSTSPVPIPRTLVSTPLGLQALFNGLADVLLVGCPPPFSCVFAGRVIGWLPNASLLRVRGVTVVTELIDLGCGHGTRQRLAQLKSDREV